MTTREPAAADLESPQRTLPGDICDVAGYRASVSGSPEHVHRAVLQVMRGFRCADDVADAALPKFAVAWTGTEWAVTINGEVVHAGDDRQVALGMLEFHLLEAALDRDTGLFHVHGAALSVPLQRAGLVLAGASGCGKTTLSLGLMLRGFMPFSDDIALVDPETLNLHPLRRAFHASAETWPLLEPLAGGPVRASDDVPPGYFVPSQWAADPVPIKWVLFPEYKPQQAPRLVPLSPAETAASILAQSGTLARVPRRALSTTTQLIQRAGCYRFLTGDLAASVAMVQKLVSEI